jgi:uncharacterized protein YktA (UPF0223 family)
MSHFELGIHRLPSIDSIMQSVISETEEEMQLFKEYEKIYGYSYYIMRAV